MDEILLTPGPLTTSKRVRDAMNKDLGSRDSVFIETTKRVREYLIELANGDDDYTCVLMQGSGTFTIESVLGSVIPPNGSLLIMSNGAYGRRMKQICDLLNIESHLYDVEEKYQATPGLTNIMLNMGDFSHVAVVHCETTTGIMNEIKEIGKVVKKYDKTFIVDAMSSFAGIPIDIKECGIDYLISSSNKCIQGVPGVGFAICNKENLISISHRPRSLSLDLKGQYEGFEKYGQWRFTPPIQTLLALDEAIKELQDEGGINARFQRYSDNQIILSLGCKAAGFDMYLDPRVQGPIITTFHLPEEYDFSKLYNGLKQRGFVIYPGKLTKDDTFRIGSIGAIDYHTINKFNKNLIEIVESKEAFR